MGSETHSNILAKIRDISQDASTAERFFQSFVESIGGIKVDGARSLKRGITGGADYLFRNNIVAELKILEKDVWDDYNRKMDDLFAKYQSSGDLMSGIDRDSIGHDDPRIPAAMRGEWYSILLKPIDKKFSDANRQIAKTKKIVPGAKGILLLLNVQNRLHAEPLRLFWLVRDRVLDGTRYPNIEAWAYFCMPVPELMDAGVNKSIFWVHFTRTENETPEGWKDQNLFMKCRGLQAQWLDFLGRELGIPIDNIPESQIRTPRP
ncbi:MAG TPA: hypothetical protein VNE63_22875 [Candidatus Acidoferrales bacterium]|nr:hypothetical protein [Candidatus Acidoferrales bacterium]